MEPHRLSVTHCSGNNSSGIGGRSVGNTSSRCRRRLSDTPSASHLMPLFNAAASSLSTGGLEVALDEWRLRNIRYRPLPEAQPMPHQVARLLVLGSAMRSPATNDDVLTLDDVLLGNSGGSYGQVLSQNRDQSNIRPPNMQESPPNIFPLPLSGLAFSTAAPRAISSYSDVVVTIRPPTSYFRPSRATVSMARPSQPSPQQPETNLVQSSTPAVTSFAWPPTLGEDAVITQQLYGLTTGTCSRLPVFEAICPAEEE